MIRKIRGRDLEYIRHLCQIHYGDEFPFPDLTHCHRIPVCDVEGQVIGGGIFRDIPEAIIIIDKNRSRRNKVQAVKELVEEGIKITREFDHEGYHVFVQDKEFEDILTKHFGFKETVGKVLFKGV
jgi:hypothetical protein